MFKKILIANRGEIACRVIRTAKRMGIQTVAVFSDADAIALHTQSADEAVHIGPPPAAESYLKVDKIIDACKQTGAEAVHPGYGFLSENTDFCQRLADAGIVFIGPGPEAITAMGDKITSKQIARDANVSVIPGFDDVIKNPKHAVELAQQVGYPVMLKPAGAGGGKGMRLAYSDQECAEGFERSTSEAKAQFDDGRVFVEKYIENPRHIEIQVLADSFGHVIYLGERECSLQRRHQKVIEEAPSPFLDAETRKAIGEQAVALAKAVNYKSAGTVEFVVDKHRKFYFLEMNTRLQVEHPVTEFTTGLDLVEWMIKIAADEPLTMKQSDLQVNGWSIESRIYAEDPARNFLPSIGRLVRYRPPKENDQIRVDTGVFEGGEVPLYYDPIIAKLVVHSDTRQNALEAMATALDRYLIKGVVTNIPFLQALIRDPVVKNGDMTTNYIEQAYPDGYNCESAECTNLESVVLVSAIVNYMTLLQSAQYDGHFTSRTWSPHREWVVILNGDHYPVSIEDSNNGHLLEYQGQTREVNHEWAPGKTLFTGTLDGKEIIVQITRKGITYQVDHQGQRLFVKVLSERASQYNEHMLVAESSSVSPYLVSPMPGLLVNISVREGQKIKAGEAVAIVEAMKMENVLRAERDGTVEKILSEVGDSLAADQPIIEFEQEDA